MADPASPAVGEPGIGQRPVPDSSGGPSYPASRRANYALGVLMLAAFTALLDRYLLGLLLEPIQQEMHISDTQASLLQGFAFAAFYSVLGLPFGLLIDRSNRRNIICAGTILWSLTTMGCGLATGYWSLFAARLGVGIGEACLAPAAFSLITDFFRPDRHGRALALYQTSVIFGGGGSFIIGAQVLQLSTWASANVPFVMGMAPWRLTFLTIGSPGLLIGLLLLTIREPRRQGRVSGEQTPTLAELAQFLRTIRLPIITLIGTGAMATVAGSGVTGWLAVFLSRKYGVPPGEAGHWIGPIIIGTALIGGLAAGWLSDSALIRNMTGRKINVLIITSAATIPLLAVFPFLATVTGAMAVYGLQALIYNMNACAVPVTLQDMVPNRFKGQVSALYYLFVGLFGYAAGPFLIAVVTDGVFGDPNALGSSLAIVGSSAMAVSLIVAVLGRSAYGKALSVARP